MAAKLVIFKSVRPNTNVAFFSTSDAQKATLQAEAAAAGATSVIGERIYSNGLKKVRTLFFPTLAHYNAWNTNAVIGQFHADREAYNTANGITETRHEVPMPNYSL